jgi:hypothetical protein
MEKKSAKHNNNVSIKKKGPWEELGNHEMAGSERRS